MKQSDSQENSAAWLSAAERTRAKVNAAWWLQSFAPQLVGLGAVAFGVIYYLRAQWLPTPAWIVASAVVGGAALAAGVAWLIARQRFYSRAECLVRLESHLRLNNALTAASAGVTPWPAPLPPERMDDGFHWRWQWIATPVLITALCLFAAFLTPVPARDSSSNYVPPLPTSVEQTEKLISELEKQDAVRKEDLEKFAQAVDQLKGQPKEEWYNHSNLEAADHLKEALQQAAGDLARNLNQAGNSAVTLEKLSDQASEKTRNAAAQQFQDAVQGMQNGSLKPNEQLLKQLQQIDPKALAKQLTAEQRQQLQEALKKAAGACQNCQGGGQRQMSSEEQALRDSLAGKGNDGDEEGNNGEEGREGPGEPDRGPGVAPLRLSKKESDLNTNRPERPEGHDLSRAAPGDLLGTTDGVHEVDKSQTGPQAGGDVGNKGQGGEAIWKESLLPSEKKVLQRYFK